MCYAASAANLIACWQNASNAVESAAPKELNDIWSTFVENNQTPTIGGTAFAVVNWWIAGVYAPSEYIPNTGENAERGSGAWACSKPR